MRREQVSSGRTSFLELPWRLWLTQANAVVRLETRRNLFSWRGAWVYFLAFAPAAIICIHAMDPRSRRYDPLAEDTQVLAAIFQFYYVRIGIFFGALGIFTRLIRGEMIERSLHYALLAPVRREVLLVGKFLAGAVRSLLLFETAVVTSFVLMYAHHGNAGWQYVFDGPGLSHLMAYVTITALACVGYGSIFLLFSMLLKNPTPVALLLMLWESISSVLPPLLQRFSIAAYLKHLMPVSVPVEGWFALLTVNTEPVAAWLAIVGSLLLTVGVLSVSCWRIRTLEISYTSE
jgi:ABC-type transport system involved in multi-copper enzyme maturation permease subunit